MVNKVVAARRSGDPVRRIQILSAILHFWRVMGPDYPATQKELCDYSRLFLDRAAGYAPKDETVVRALCGLVASGSVGTRSPQPKAILYWMAPGNVDPLFPAYDREAYASLKARDPFPVFASDGRPFLVARRGRILPYVVPIQSQKPHLGPFTWWRACHQVCAAFGVRFWDELDRACDVAVRAAHEAVLGYVWACHTSRQQDAIASRIAASFGGSRERRDVKPEHEFGATCSSGDCSVNQAAQRALGILESRYGGIPMARRLRPIYRELDRRIQARVSLHAKTSMARGVRSRQADSASFRETIDVLKGLRGPSADVFQQWERAWSSGLVDMGRAAGGGEAPKSANPARLRADEARARCILMVHKGGLDPAEAARETGASVSKVAQWLEEFDRVALVAPHVEPGKISRATGLARPSSRAYLALWAEIQSGQR